MQSPLFLKCPGIPEWHYHFKSKKKSCSCCITRNEVEHFFLVNKNLRQHYFLLLEWSQLFTIMDLISKETHFFFFKFYLIYFEKQWERACEQRRGRDGERESQASSMLSAEPDARLRPTKPWDHDLIWNSELDASPTEPHRSTQRDYFLNSLKWNVL